MSETPSSRSRTPWLLGGGVALAGLAAGLVWFSSGDEPAAVDLTAGSAAVADEGVTDADTETDTETDADTDANDTDADTDANDADPDAGAAAPAPADPVADPTGTWTVDPGAVAFDREAGEGTFVGYRIDEELSGIGAFTAVGRTPDVAGSVTIDGTTVTAAEVTGDLTTLQSDDGRRDGRVRSTFSGDGTARFVLDGPVDVGAVPSDGEVLQASATGTLTVEGVSREVGVALQATVLDGRLVVAGSTTISLDDFEVTAPSAPIVLGVSDEAVVEWQVHLTRG